MTNRDSDVSASLVEAVYRANGVMKRVAPNLEFSAEGELESCIADTPGRPSCLILPMWCG